MSKYKVGDKVLLECQIEQYGDEPILAIGGYRMKLDDGCEGCITHKTYEQGLADAWNLARKIFGSVDKGGYSDEQLEEVFGCSYLTMTQILYDFTPQEALAKIEAYEQEIKVGDVIRAKEHDGVTEILITKIYSEDKTFDGFKIMPRADFGGVFCDRKIERYEKTGKHLNIQQILDGIGKE